MAVEHVVLDTNVLVAGLRSQRGASFKLLSMLGPRSEVQIHVSVPLVLEYEATLLNQKSALGLTVGDISDVLDYICAIAGHHEIFYLWRPVLRDPKDDMVLEVAVASGCPTIVSYNKADFRGSERFGVDIETAREFLIRVGVLK